MKMQIMRIMRMRKRDKWRYIEISGDWEVEN